MSKIKSILTVMALMPCCAFAESFLISTPNTSLVLEGEKEAGLTIAYYGERLTDSEVIPGETCTRKPIPHLASDTIRNRHCLCFTPMVNWLCNWYSKAANGSMKKIMSL